MLGDIFGCHSGRAASGFWWVEGREAANHPTMCRTVSTTKDYPALNVRTGTDHQTEAKTSVSGGRERACDFGEGTRMNDVTGARKPHCR